MADLAIGPLVSMVMDKASSYLLDKYKVMEGMERQRKVQERILPAILYIIQHAEEKGAFRPEVAVWLKDLQTAAYEANDVFDEFKYEALQREAKKKGQQSKHGTEIARLLLPARNPIVFHYRMGKKLCMIVQNIEDLVTDMNKFDLGNLQQAQPSRQWRQTDSIIIDSDRDIVSRSRDGEKKKVVGMLLDQATSNMDLMVLPIVGPGRRGIDDLYFVKASPDLSSKQSIKWRRELQGAKDCKHKCKRTTCFAQTPVPTPTRSEVRTTKPRLPFTSTSGER